MEMTAMKPYTIIDIWGEGGSHDCWIAHFSTREAARECLASHLRHYVPAMTDADIGSVFDSCLSGVGFDYASGSETGTVFVRHEEVGNRFCAEDMPWNI